MGADCTEIVVIWAMDALFNTRTLFSVCCVTYNLPSVTATALGAVTDDFVAITLLVLALITEIELPHLFAT